MKYNDIAEDILNKKFTKNEEYLNLNKFTVKKSNKKFKELLNNNLKLVGEELFTKFDNRQTKYNKFINSVVPIANFNFMADLLILPKTSEGYRYLLVVVYLATSLFDMQPMKQKLLKIV